MKRIFIILIVLTVTGCTSQPQDNMTDHQEAPKEGANKLISSTSPYLLQHAYNPVDWYPWGDEALAKAKKEDKPIIVSIGYSSCHWCHVMERESFENDSIAQLMNDNFITIKVDREERPDVDQIYMDAVQAMGLNGGWPLNVFLTPDQKPFFGGTYFPPQQWGKLLNNISVAFKTKREEIENSANELTDILTTSEVIKYKLEDNNNGFKIDNLDSMYRTIAANFDKEKGGFDRAPKFPMPANWSFLLRYNYFKKDQKALNQVIKTLNEIAKGGIYDQVGGGFARYSTDADWFAPHFEKMLYDNGQLMSLYSEAYIVTQHDLYKKVVYQTMEWLKREMSNNEGGFYSALDADSEGEEGKFYVWQKNEIDNLLGSDAALIVDYYNVKEDGNWEDGKNILHKKISDEEFARSNNLTIDALQEKIAKANAMLLNERANRVRPGLDDKVLSGWNGLMLKGLSDAYLAFGDEVFLDMAVKNASFLKEKMLDGDKLYRSYKDGKASLDAYLEDYAAVIDGLKALYQVTFDEQWLTLAKNLTDYTIDNFYDAKENLFFFTDNNSERLIARKKEFFDNVIPSSNSIMAHNLYGLGIIYDNADYQEKARAMMNKVSTFMLEEPSYMSNWAILYSYMSTPTAEIAIVGDDFQGYRNEFARVFHPNKVVMGASKESDLPLMEGKYAVGDKTTIYVCYNKTCKLPVTSVSKAYAQLK